MSSFAGSAFRALALGVFALFLAHSGAATAERVYGWLSQTSALAGQDSLAVRRHILGITYVRAIERLRRTIPRDGEYLLVRGSTEGEGGGAYWVRFELAPRRARFLGGWNELPDGETLRRRLPSGSRWVIIAYSEPRAPVLMEREEFLRALDRSHDGV
ncbi:MAG TPA: hypothetical protein VGX68_04690 [Thermoanaerobaculia bacterium]|nr:hypothetical protein [Thermoanaerobaculia bacterium]